MPYIARRYRLCNHVGGVRKRLAKKIVWALAEQGIKARCEGRDLLPAMGYWRQVEQDVLAWEGSCEVWMEDGQKWSRRSVESWDRMTTCLKGFNIEPDGFGFAVSANHELEPAKRFKIIRVAAERAATRS